MYGHCRGRRGLVSVACVHRRFGCTTTVRVARQLIGRHCGRLNLLALGRKRGLLRLRWRRRRYRIRRSRSRVFFHQIICRGLCYRHRYGCRCFPKHTVRLHAQSTGRCACRHFISRDNRARRSTLHADLLTSDLVTTATRTQNCGASTAVGCHTTCPNRARVRGNTRRVHVGRGWCAGCFASTCL
jgi:hypothetical protein